MSMLSTRAALACEYSAAPEPRPEITDSRCGPAVATTKSPSSLETSITVARALRVFDVSPVMMMAPDSIWLRARPAAAYCASMKVINCATSTLRSVVSGVKITGLW
jgi:hypothetical protein